MKYTHFTLFIRRANEKGEEKVTVEFALGAIHNYKQVDYNPCQLAAENTLMAEDAAELWEPKGSL